MNCFVLNSNCIIAVSDRIFCCFQAETVMRISQYVKSHPQASQAQLKAEVEKEIKIFAQKVAQLEGM